LTDPYVLDNTAAEQVRLSRQAVALRPITERLFRAAGIGSGMTVLDVGCGNVWVSETRRCRSCHHRVLVDRPAEAVGSMWSLGVDVYNDVGRLARRARATLSE
jgi:hypothetical protein